MTVPIPELKLIDPVAVIPFCGVHVALKVAVIPPDNEAVTVMVKVPVIPPAVVCETEPDATVWIPKNENEPFAVTAQVVAFV